MSFGRREMTIGAVVLVVVVLVGLAAFGFSGTKGKRAELERYVTAIREAELAHHAKFDEYVGTDWAPRPRFEIDGKGTRWTDGGAFAKIGWAPPDDPVFGAYRVTVSGNGFTVTGVSDLDEDGEQAVYVATADQETTRQTAENVY